MHSEKLLGFERACERAAVWFRRSLSVELHPLRGIGSEFWRSGPMFRQWLQIEDEGGQEYLSICKDFGLSYRIVDFTHFSKEPYHCPYAKQLSFVHCINHFIQPRFL